MIDMRTATTAVEDSPGTVLAQVLEQAGATVVILGSCDFGAPGWSEHLAVELPGGRTLGLDVTF